MQSPASRLRFIEKRACSHASWRPRSPSGPSSDSIEVEEAQLKGSDVGVDELQVKLLSKQNGKEQQRGPYHGQVETRHHRSPVSVKHDVGEAVRRVLAATARDSLFCAYRGLAAVRCLDEALTSEGDLASL